MIVLLEAMCAAAHNERCSNDAKFATFLYEDLGPGLAKRLTKEKSVNENVSERYFESCFSS